MPPKHTFLVSIDQLKDIVLPPDYTFHGSDGRPIPSEQVAARAGCGETIEIYHQGASVGRVRPPRATDRFSPRMVDAIGELLEKAKREDISEAVNWIDRVKDRFWCPICAKNQSHPGCISTWISPEPECQPISYYAICRRCAKAGQNYHANAHRSIEAQEAFTRIADLSSLGRCARESSPSD